MNEQQATVAPAQTNPPGESSKWGELPLPERIAELEARLAEWEQMNAETRSRLRSPFDYWSRDAEGTFGVRYETSWQSNLTGADVFYLASRALSSTAKEEDIAAAAARLRPADGSHPWDFVLSSLHLEGTRLMYAHLEGAYLRSAHLEGALLHSVYLQNADLYQVHLEGARLGGTHLEGALLNHAHLEGAEGTGYDGILYGVHLEGTYLGSAHLEGANLGPVHLEGANLSGAHLEGARLGGTLGLAHLEGATLEEAHLEGATLEEAHLEGATLQGASFDKASRLNGAVLTGASFDQVTFDNTNLAVVDWGKVTILGDERTARDRMTRRSKPKNRVEWLFGYQAAVRANRVLAVALQAQGLSEDAARFAYRAQLLQRQVLRRQGRLLSALGSRFLDLISGYGYRPMRSFITYALVILGFAAAYFTLGGANGNSLTWNEAIVISMTAFHGRGFFSAVFQPGDLQAAVAAVEAFIGLLIEIVFIATFTNRFFAR